MRRIDHLVAVPNVSEGRDAATIAGLADSVRDAGARVLDVHSDAVHNRTVVTLAVLILEEMHQRIGCTRDLFVLAAASVLENFGYRQLNNFWRVLGLIDFLRRKKEWGEMTRKRFGSHCREPIADPGVSRP